MKIINYGHSCFQIVGKDIKLLFDPYQNDSVPGLRLANIKTDIVLISHDHHDHNAKNLVDYKQDYYDDAIIINTAHDKEKGKLRGHNKVHVVNVDGFKIVHFGDIGDPNINLEPFMNADILLIPINGYYTIGALEALDIYKKTNAKILIPMHFFDKNHKIGYEDGGQIDTLIHHVKEIKYIENDEFEFTNNHKGIYVFKKVRGNV